MPPSASRARSIVSAIVLAAGRSIRMGESKPLVKVGGRPLLQHVLDGLATAPVSEVVVVLGHDADRLGRDLAWGRARTVLNPDFLEGMSSSIRAGIRAADPSAGAYLMVLGDQPFVDPATLDTLVRAWRTGSARLVIPTFRGRRGNPVLVDRELTRAMDTLSGDQGFRSLFSAHESETLDVSVDDPGILFDVDTPEDLTTLQAWLDQGLRLEEAVRQAVAGRLAPRE